MAQWVREPACFLEAQVQSPAQKFPYAVCTAKKASKPEELVRMQKSAEVPGDKDTGSREREPPA